jgi:nitrite reductase/ring-hydroxylating ferredoxin subunit
MGNSDMPEIFVARSDDLKEGQRKLLETDGRTIGVIRAKGNLHAFLNICPHQGGPVCEGRLIHRVEEVLGEHKTFISMRFVEEDLHIVCPWHGWEFNIETGRCAGDGRHSLKRFEVVERDGHVYVVV